MNLLLRWLIVIPFALVMAMTGGMIAFFLASAFVPELGLLIGMGFEALIATLFDDAAAGYDSSARLLNVFALGGRLAFALFVAPILLVALMGEIFALRGGVIQAVLTGLLAAVLPLAMLQIGRSPTSAELRVSAALFFVGVVTGFVYWLIAGRHAGGRADKAVNVPASRGS
jgi:hypothetical protein